MPFTLPGATLFSLTSSREGLALIKWDWLREAGILGGMAYRGRGSLLRIPGPLELGPEQWLGIEGPREVNK